MPQSKKTFLYQASRVLDHDPFTNLEEFLEAISQPSLSNDDRLQPLLEQEYAAFIVKENLVINNGAQSLSTWHGRANSRLGIVLHSRTRRHSSDSQNRIPFCNDQKSMIEDVDNSFWDEDSLTIQALEAKSVNKTLIFGFDWHWRALPWSAKTCQAKKEFGPTALDLHDAFSRRILEILPLPLLIVGGFCPRGNIQPCLSNESQTVSIPFDITNQNNPLQFDLIFDLIFQKTQLKTSCLHASPVNDSI